MALFVFFSYIYVNYFVLFIFLALLNRCSTLDEQDSELQRLRDG